MSRIDPDDAVRAHYDAQELPPEVLAELVGMRPRRRGRWVAGAVAVAATVLLSTMGVLGAAWTLTLTGREPSVHVDAQPGPSRALVDTGAPWGPRPEELAALGYVTTEEGWRGADGRPGRREAVVRTPVDPMATLAPEGFVKTVERPFSTFAADVDNASWIQARELLAAGREVPRQSVRLEEFVNAMPYGYPDPTEGVFGVSTAVMSHPSQPDVQLVRIGVQGRRMDPATRPPLNLTFLVDVSGSMAAEDKLPLVQRSLQALTASLGPDDSVALVTYANGSRVVLPSTRATPAGQSEIRRAIASLSSGGGTAMGDGLSLAYGQAARQHRDGAVSRVIVASDGDANVGVTRGEDLAASIRTHADAGIALTALGVGAGRGRDEAMEKLSNQGDGQYYFLGNPDDAERVLVDRLVSTLVPLARDVKLQVEWDAEVVASYRLLGYDNRRLADEDFRRDAVDAGEIGPGHQVTALYLVERVPGSEAAALGVLRLRAKPPGRDAPAAETAFVLHSAVASPEEVEDDTAVAVAAAALAADLLGERLLPLDGVVRRLEAVDASAPEVSELLTALRRRTDPTALPSPRSASGVVSIKAPGQSSVAVRCGGDPQIVVLQGGRAVVSGVPDGTSCEATVRGPAGEVSLKVTSGGSYLCDGDPLRCRPLE